MDMVRNPYKSGEVIFNFGEKSDDLYLICSGSVETVSREELARWPRSLASLNAMRALVRNQTSQLADAKKMNEESWLLLSVYQNLDLDKIELSL